MFEREFTTHQNRIASASSKSEVRKMALETGIEFASVAIERLEADEAHAAGEFRRRKAAWERHVENDENPREIPEHTHASRNYRGGGICAIGIEVGIATYAFYQMLASYGLPLTVSLALGLVLALVITLPLAYLFHGAIHYLVTRLSEPVAQLRRLTVYFVYLSLIFVGLSIVAYVALFRLDPETVYALQGILSAMKFVAMFGFMVLGAALLVAADLYGWSRSRAQKFKAILDEQLAIKGKRREWQNELAAFVGQPLTVPQQAMAVSKPAQQTPPQPTSPNGTSVSATVANSIVPVLLLVAVLSGLSACAAHTPRVKLVTVQEAVVCNVVIDASGDPDGSDQKQEEIRQRALRQAGLNVIESVKKTIEREHVTELSVFWLGEHGWMLDTKLALTIPPYKRAELVKRDAGEFDRIRPDVADVEKQRSVKALAEAEAQISVDYRREIEKALVRFNIDTVVPPTTADSPCTDLNGMLARFAQPSSAAKRILYVVTDGRQSCGGTDGIQKVIFPENTAVIIVLIPGFAADGHDDFEQRRALFSEACTGCEVLPFFSPNLDTVVAESFKKRNGLLSSSKQQASTGTPLHH